MKTPIALAFSALAFLGTSRVAIAQDYEVPRFHISASGGRSMLAGSRSSTSTQPGSLFQFDDKATTYAANLSLRFVAGLRLDLEGAIARGRDEGAVDRPDSQFFSGGLSYAVFTTKRGRLAPYIAAGGGITRQRTLQSFKSDTQEAFEGQSNPFAYGGAGIEYRFTRMVGIRAGYRYTRIYPDSDSVGATGTAERKNYGAHRVLGGLTLGF